MYEICAFIQSTNPIRKTRKVSDKPRAKSVRIGARVLLHDREVIIVDRDSRYPNAWFVEIDGVRSQYSFSRDMLKVI